MDHPPLDTDMIATIAGFCLGLSAISVNEYRRQYEKSDMMHEEPNEDDLPADLFWEIVFGTAGKQQHASPPKLTPEHDGVLQTIITERGNRNLQTTVSYLTAVLLDGTYEKYPTTLPPERSRGPRKRSAPNPDTPQQVLFTPVDGNLSEETVRKRLRTLQYEWVDVRKAGEQLNKMTKGVQTLADRFVKRFRRLRKYEFVPYRDSAGKWCVNLMIYFDESFVHRYDSSRYSWMRSDVVVRKRALGDRFCISGFISELGPIPGSFDCFVGAMGAASSDYHDMMDSHKFMQILDKLEQRIAEWWEDTTASGLRSSITGRLKVHPDGFTGVERVVVQLIIDNAPYHKTVDTTKSFLLTEVKKNKTNLCDAYIKYGGQQYPTTIQERVSPMSPQDAETEKRAWLMSQTKVKLVELVTTLHGELKQAHGNRLYLPFNHIYAKGWHVYTTPPYFPEFQPIEYVWNHGKAQVKKNAATYDYTRDMFRQFVIRTFSDISVDVARRFIAAAEKEIEDRGQQRNIPAEEDTPYDPGTNDYQVGEGSEGIEESAEEESDEGAIPTQTNDAVQ
ncbi:MAG: hypothetical protein Q7U84_04275 [Polynucleobacter sp.]|nr:hypothetical protein [Polynucleobacter sp.]